MTPPANDPAQATPIEDAILFNPEAPVHARIGAGIMAFSRLQRDLAAARLEVEGCKRALEGIGRIVPFMSTQRFAALYGEMPAKMRNLALAALDPNPPEVDSALTGGKGAGRNTL